MTALGIVLIGGGLMLGWAGVTGQSLTAELRAAFGRTAPAPAPLGEPGGGDW